MIDADKGRVPARTSTPSNASTSRAPGGGTDGSYRGSGFRIQRTDDDRNACPDDTRLLCGNLRERVSQVLFMIKGNRRNGGRYWFHAVGGIQPPAQPHFKDRELDTRAPEHVEGHGGGHFEERGRCLQRAGGEERLHVPSHPFDGGHHRAGVYGLPVNGEPLFKVNEMRRGVPAHAQAGRP